LSSYSVLGTIKPAKFSAVWVFYSQLGFSSGDQMAHTMISFQHSNSQSRVLPLVVTAFCKKSANIILLHRYFLMSWF